MVRIVLLPPLFQKGAFVLVVLFIVAHPTLSKQSPTKTSLVKISKTASGRAPRPPGSNQAPTVKSEPLNEDEGLRHLHSPGMKKSKKVRNSSPIVVSSDESNAPTPRARAKPAATVVKIDNAFSDKLKKRYVRYSGILSISFSFLMLELSAPSTPRTKIGGKASSHVILSSDESDPSTPRAKIAKNDNAFSSDRLKKGYV